MVSSSLSAGSIVCLVGPDNQALAAKPRGKSGWSLGWELKAVPLPGEVQGAATAECLPLEALFVVLRRGAQLGFKALGADGRTVQAAEALNEPHRIHNHNFGAWESWEDVGGELVNSQWAHKKLGYTPRPVAAVPADIFDRIDLQHKRELMRLQKQMEKAHQGAVLARGSLQGASWDAQEVEALRRQLADCTRELQHWQQQAAARQAALEEAQAQQRGEPLGAVHGGMGLPSQAAATIAGLRADLREARAQHAEQLAQAQAGHECELEALRQEHAAMLREVLQQSGAMAQQAQQQGEAGARRLGAAGARGAGTREAADAAREEEVGELRQQLEVLQRRLALATAERDAAVGVVRAEMQAALHAKEEECHRLLLGKDSEIFWLLEERQRLDLALHTIKDMTAIVRQASPATAAALGPAGASAAARRQPAQAAQPGGARQGQQGLGQQRAGADPAAMAEAGPASGRDSGHSLPLLASPAFTVLGLPLGAGGSGSGSGDVTPAADSPASSADGLSGAVSIAAAVPASFGVQLQQQEQQQAARRPAAGAAAAPGSPAAEGRAERQGSSTAVQEQQREQQQQQEEGATGATCSSLEEEGSTAAGPALASGQLRLPRHTGPPAEGPPAHEAVGEEPAPTRPWEVRGAVDLGAALGRPRDAAPRPSAAPGGPRREGYDMQPSQQAQQATGRGSRAGGGAGAGSSSHSPGPSHPVFNSEARSRISTLYDLLNPFDPGSVASDSPGPRGSRRAEQQQQQQQQARREGDMIRVSSLRGLAAEQPEEQGAGRRQPGGGAGGEDESSEGGSIHRVSIGGSYLVDYNGPRPDSMTEEALARILDVPLRAPIDPEEGKEGLRLRWRGRPRRPGASPEGTAPAPARRAHPHPPASSAPASVAGSDGEAGGGGAGAASPDPPAGAGGWSAGSFSLPGSSRATPLAPERSQAWEAPGASALGDLPKEQVAARRNRGAGTPGRFLPPSEAVKALTERSPGGADAVAQLMSDRVTMRASMPTGGWLASARKGSTYRRLDLPPDGLEERSPSHPKQPPNPLLRKSAPAGPLPAAAAPPARQAGRRANPLRRSSFLQRPPCAFETLYGD